ncbi:hypothetical protein SFHH103_03479 [Sinorhizobium fredii HH103]|uniref:Uncharacterized protein n=1 Tax=Sinorhizobium fredii (strain HH103) TaxID=1117943 RepID=G9A3M2_SINF1|nr:hypothetical protein SFHH103_03479 [Sinorhizobium fredii HH103]
MKASNIAVRTRFMNQAPGILGSLLVQRRSTADRPGV